MIHFINIQYTMDSRTLKTIRDLMSLCFCVCVGGVTVFVECWVGEIYIYIYIYIYIEREREIPSV